MIPPHYLDLVADAALKSYWRKRALRLFLRRCGVAEGFLATWQSDESKRDLLHRLFPRLEEQGDAGLRLINRMADALIQQVSFPDLSGWEDSEQKCAKAQAAVDTLKAYREKQQVQVATAKERAEAKRRAEEISAEIKSRESDLEKLEAKFVELSKEIGTEGAGYAFQNWFYELADFFEVLNRKPFYSNGRQIDGSLTVDGTTYLVELKFTASQVGSTDIDSLYKKVSTKADNTMGIMVSVSGYSSTAKREASGPRGLLMLLDHNHLFLLMRGSCSMEDLVCRIRRHSSQTGEAYLHVADFKE